MRAEIENRLEGITKIADAIVAVETITTDELSLTIKDTFLIEATNLLEKELSSFKEN